MLITTPPSLFSVLLHEVSRLLAQAACPWTIGLIGLEAYFLRGFGFNFLPFLDVTFEPLFRRDRAYAFGRYCLLLSVHQDFYHGLVDLSNNVGELANHF